MESVAIFPVFHPDGGRAFRAVSKEGQSEGRTIGEALDGVCSDRFTVESETLVVIQPFRPDAFFGQVERQRLQELMARWRVARDEGRRLTMDEERELQDLVDAELAAASTRAQQMVERLAG